MGERALIVSKVKQYQKHNSDSLSEEGAWHELLKCFSNDCSVTLRATVVGGARALQSSIFRRLPARAALPAAACARELETDIFYSAECVTGN